jgi:hypothetical protein
MSKTSARFNLADISRATKAAKAEGAAAVDREPSRTTAFRASANPPTAYPGARWRASVQKAGVCPALGPMRN